MKTSSRHENPLEKALTCIVKVFSSPRSCDERQGAWSPRRSATGMASSFPDGAIESGARSGLSGVEQLSETEESSALLGSRGPQTPVPVETRLSAAKQAESHDH